MQIAVPRAFAQPLFREGVCRMPLTSRGLGAEAAATVTLLGVAADLATVMVSVSELREFARGLVRNAWRARPESRAAEVSIQVARADGSTVAVSVRGLEDEEAAALVHDAVVAALTTDT